MAQQRCLSLTNEQEGAEGCQMGFRDEVKQQLGVVALNWSWAQFTYPPSLPLSCLPFFFLLSIYPLLQCSPHILPICPCSSLPPLHSSIFHLPPTFHPSLNPSIHHPPSTLLISTTWGAEVRGALDPKSQGQSGNNKMNN